MATNTYQTYLMTSEDGKVYEKLVDIKEFPDLGSAPNTLDSTTLSDPMHTYIPDILDTGGALEFTANYDPEDYKRITGLADEERFFSVWCGGAKDATTGDVQPDGHDGKFDFKGRCNAWLKGAGVGAVKEMGVAVTPSTPIKANID